MDKVYFLLQRVCDQLEKSKKFLMDETLFPAKILTNGQDKDDCTDDDEDTDEDKDEDKEVGQHPSADSDENVYTKEDEWGTLYTDELDGIFKDFFNAVGEQSAKILHDFAITTWACSIQPHIMLDIEAHMTGYHNAIEKYIK